MKNFSAKAVCEGAVVSALTVILVLMGTYVPVISMLAVFICGLPLAYLAVKYNAKSAIIAFIVSLIILFIITGNIISVIINACVVMLPGFVAGCSIGRNKSYYNTFFAVSAAVLFGVIVNILMINAYTGSENGIAEMLESTVNSAKNMLMPIVQEAENSGAAGISDAIDSIFVNTKIMILSYFPTILIIYSLSIGYLALASVIFFMKRMCIKDYEYVKFSMLKAPKSMSIVLVILMLVSLLSDDATIYTLALKNVTAVLAFILAVNGLSLLDFSLQRKIPSGYARFGIYAAVMLFCNFIISILFYLLMLAGMIDANRDIRMLKRVGDDGEN